MKSENSMSFEEAVKVLGLKKGETVDSYRRAFEEVRKHMQRLRDEADSPEKKANYEKELTRFEEALEVATHHRPKKSRVVKAVVALLLVALAAGAAFFAGPSLMSNQAAKKKAEARLPEAQVAVAARNWSDAEEIFNEILAVNPRSKEAKEGLQEVNDERDKELKMNVGFALGQADTLMNERKWDEAEKAMKTALAMDPEDEQLQAFASRMEERRKIDDIVVLGEDIEQARREEQWGELVAKVAELEAANPDDERLPEYQKLAAQGRIVLDNLRKEAAEVYLKALALDKGEYSEEALDLLREAQRLSPSKDAADLYRKMSTYVQTIAIPGDAPTLAEGLARARVGDKIALAEGTYMESLLVPAGVSIEGEKGKTIIQSPAEDGSVLVVQGEGQAVRLVGLVIKHSGITAEKERFPVVLVSGAELVLEDCEVSYGAGHGVAVMDGGRCEITASEVKGCGWDGVAIVGAGSTAVLTESRSLANLHHGLDVWGGGQVTVDRSRFQNNGLTGIFLSSAGKVSSVENSSVERNREVGLMVTQGAMAEVTGNLISGNMLGGVFADGEGTEISLSANTIQKNGEVGLVVGAAATLKKNEGNTTSENEGKQEWLDADLTAKVAKPLLRALPVE